MLISQISWVIKLVIAQQVLLIQISLGPAGYEATCKFSNFIGPYAGQNATNAGQSNFWVIGYSATSANNSNLFGYNAGS
jgi:hypothetical protein